ncbi:MAG: AMP-binding protein, partial [Nannocystaceae bacterium]
KPSSLALLPARVEVEALAGGTLVLRSPVALGEYPRCLSEYLEHWARATPEHVFLRGLAPDSHPWQGVMYEGSPVEVWEQVTYAECEARVIALARGLLGRGLGPNRPVMILSGNSLEHALLALAAMHVGIPVAPVSPAYSLMSRDFHKLRWISKLIQPGLVFADDAARFAGAVQVVLEECAASGVPEPLVLDRLNSLPAEVDAEVDAERVREAAAAVGPDTVAKILFTSGSTGTPKGVINTQRMMCANQQAIAQCWPFLARRPPLLVDWLPWNHTFGGNHNFNMVLAHGGTLVIDRGKPAPGLVEHTVENLRVHAPTMYFNVPRGFDMLLPYLESDSGLAEQFFSQLDLVFYAGAALPQSLWTRLDALAQRILGHSVMMSSAWGATETAPLEQYRILRRQYLD